jgi:hypothetical protein
VLIVLHVNVFLKMKDEPIQKLLKIDFCSIPIFTYEKTNCNCEETNYNYEETNWNRF